MYNKYDEDASSFIRKEPCPACGSRDNLARYSDGHGFCFGCFHRQAGNDANNVVTKRIGKMAGLDEYVDAEYAPLSKRMISEDTCKKFGVKVGLFKGQRAHFYPYYKDNQVVACKVRLANKEFSIIGDGHDLPVFGSNLWFTGKKIIVTEGEIDALTVSQVQGNKWPVVSIPNGAKAAKKAISKNLEYFDKFEEIIFMFDMDSHGQEAAKECVDLFKPGKAKIASLPLKDANECLLANKPDAIISSIWNAKIYRPDGIISGEDLWEELNKEDTTVAMEYPWRGLNLKTGGIRRGELVTFTAGSGIGKSAVVKEIAYKLIQDGETVGMLMLEENPKRTALGLMGIHLNQPLHINKEPRDEESFNRAFMSTVGSGRCYLYDHFGSNSVDNLLSRIRFLARGCGAQWIILDHLSIIVSGIDGGDERRLIDNTMTALRTLVEETGIGMVLVSHLKRPDGKGHEEGAVTSLSQLRGSHAIAQLSDMVIGLERDQQDDKKSDETTVRVLKNRFSGETGIACSLIYDKITGRLAENLFQDTTKDSGNHPVF